MVIDDVTAMYMKVVVLRNVVSFNLVHEVINFRRKLLSRSALSYPEDDFKELLLNITALQYHMELHSGSFSTSRDSAACLG
jgi:hypothetical protein